MNPPSLLLAVDDRELKEQLLNIENLKLFKIHIAEPKSQWINQLASTDSDLVLVQADDFDEVELNAIVNSGSFVHHDVVFISNGEPNPHIDAAMLRGATYHMRLPLDDRFLGEVVQEIYNERSHQNKEAESTVASELDQFGLLVGSSGVMRRLYRVIRKAAESEVNVFIIGESGSGKDLVANTIHLSSIYCNKPFIPINCGALSPELIESELFGHVKGAFTGANKDRVGLIEQAEGGTLFLDEITEMPLEHQVKLLRVLETGEYRPVGSEQLFKANVRVIAATNREPAEAINEERFREDLYFRLAHFPIRIPPLRRRQTDIVGLAKHFLAYRNTREQTKKSISAEAITCIEKYNWPGNVRELKHTIERAYILAEEMITPEHLIMEEQRETYSQTKTTLPQGIPLEEVEKGVILKTLAANNGNKTETAEQLGISVKTLYNKLEKYQVMEE